MKAQSPHPSMLGCLSTPCSSPFLKSECKLYSLHFLVFVNSFTTCITNHPNTKYLERQWGVVVKCIDSKARLPGLILGVAVYQLYNPGLDP